MADSTYATITELKPLVSIEATNTASDTMLQRILNSAARQFDMKTRNPLEGTEAFAATASATRYFDDNVFDGYVAIDDCLTVTAVTRDGVTIAATDYKLWPYNRGNGPATRLYWSITANASVGSSVFYGSPWPHTGAGTIAITGTWGYCTAANRPDEVKNAVLNLAAIMYKTQALDINAVMQMVSIGDPVGIMARNVRDAVNTFRKDKRFQVG